MSDAAPEMAWTEGIVRDIWDQMLTLCEPQAVGHIQLTCKYWKQQCRLRLTQLELPPQPTAELQALAAALPSIKQLRLTCRYKYAPASYMQAPPVHILRRFSLLTSLTIEGDNELQPDALKVVKDLSRLQVLSLPAGHSLAQQVTDKQLPEALTSLSINGLIRDSHSWTLQDLPDTLHNVQLGEITLTSDSQLSWLQQLSSIQHVSMRCHFFGWGDEDLYPCLDCLICAPNLRNTDLQVEYSKSDVNVLRALSKLTSLSHLTLGGGRDNCDPQLSSPRDWLLSLTSVSSIEIFNLSPSVCIAAVSMTWLSAMSPFFEGHQLSTANTLASLAQLTRLTSLKLQGPALGNAQLTFLHSLADLAVCVLDASWHDLHTYGNRLKDLRHGYQAMSDIFVIASKFPIRPRFQAKSLGSEHQFAICEVWQHTPGFKLFYQNCGRLDSPNTSVFVWLPVPNHIAGFELS